MAHLLPLHLCLALALACALPAAAQDPVYGYEGDDPEMQAAIAGARATLPLFYEKLAAIDLSQEMVLVKVGVPYGDPADNNEEHIWLGLLSRQGDAFEGYFANEPVYIPYRLNDLYRFDEAAISDWAYWDEAGMMHGAYTIRVMLGELPEDQAEEYRRILAPLHEAP